MPVLLCLLLAAAAAEPVPAAEPGPATMPLDAAPGPDPAVRRRVRLFLRGGREITGELLGQSKEAVTIRTAAGAPVRIDRASINAVEDADAAPSPEHWFRDPGVSRTFFAPTGFMLREGEGYFSQKELLFSSFGYGLTDHVTALVGTVLPIGLAPNTANLVGGIKVGGDLNEVWHVAAGALAVAFPFIQQPAPILGEVFGTVTAGTPARSLTLAVGVASETDAFASATIVIVEVGAAWRVAPNVALETESWFFPNLRSTSSTEPFMMFNSGGVRLLNEHLSVDLGLVRLPGAGLPLPWVDFTYSFGS